jgi:hypothetical protein
MAGVDNFMVMMILSIETITVGLKGLQILCGSIYISPAHLQYLFHQQEQQVE